MKKIFPHIQRLDGRNLSPEGSCVPQRNYLCSIDSYDLIEQFVRHYFGVYDSNTRATLLGLYSKTAILSISSNFSGLTSKSNDGRLKFYQSKSRNILRISQPAMVKTCFHGHEQLKQLWKDLPQSMHDYKSFTIDVTYYSVSVTLLT